MPILKPKLRSRLQDYLLEDRFEFAKSAGAVNGTRSTGGQLRTGVDTENKLSIANGVASFSGGRASPASGDPGWYYTPPIVRRDGQLFFFSFNSGNVGVGKAMTIGLATSATTNVAAYANLAYGLSVYDTGVNGFLASAVELANPAILTLVANTDYQLCICVLNLGAYAFLKGGVYTLWTYVGRRMLGTNTPLWVTESNYNMAFATDSITVPNQTWKPPALAYDSFTKSTNFLALGDSKTYVGAQTNWPTNMASYYAEYPTRIATSGWTTHNLRTNIDARLATAVGTPSYCLINIGVNDGASPPTQSVWMADAAYINAALHAKYPAAQIYWMRPGVRDGAAWCTTLAGWITTAMGLQSWTHVGPDEQVFLEGGDDYATYTLDGCHPNDAGSILEAAQWDTLLGVAQVNPPIGVTQTVNALGLSAPQLVWTVDQGAAEIVQSYAQFTALDGNGIGIATVPTGSVNVSVECTVSRSAGNPGVVLRYTNSDNYLYAMYDGTNCKLIERVAGSETTRATHAAAFISTVRVDVYNNNGRLYCNNELIGATAAIGPLTGNKHGIYTTNTGNKFRYLDIMAVGVEGQYSVLNTLGT